MRRATIADVQAEVKELLQWDDETYSKFMYDTGVAYLYSYLEDNNKAVAFVEKRAEYWNWFKNLWAIRDEVFIDHEAMRSMGLAIVRNMYFALHSPSLLAHEIRPNRVVLGNNFHIPFKMGSI